MVYYRSHDGLGGTGDIISALPTRLPQKLRVLLQDVRHNADSVTELLPTWLDTRKTVAQSRVGAVYTFEQLVSAGQERVHQLGTGAYSEVCSACKALLHVACLLYCRFSQFRLGFHKDASAI